MSASAPSAAGSASGAGSAPPASARATSQAVPEHILREAARRSTKMPRPRGSVSQTPPPTAPPGTAEPPPVFGLPPDLQGQGSGPVPAPETEARRTIPPWMEAYVMQQSTGSAGSAAGQSMALPSGGAPMLPKDVVTGFRAQLDAGRQAMDAVDRMVLVNYALAGQSQAARDCLWQVLRLAPELRVSWRAGGRAAAAGSSAMQRQVRQ